MSNSCFGCCSVRSCITGIFVFNTLWITSQIIVQFMYRLNNYYQFDYDTKSLPLITTPQSFDYTQDPNYFPKLRYYNDTVNRKLTPRISPLFMDYIFIVYFGWYVMELFLNAILQQTKYKNSPDKVYAWLAIYYANLCGSIIGVSVDTMDRWTSITIEEYLFAGLEVLIIGLEIYAVRKYYKQQKLAAVGDVIRLKWKYLPRTKTRLDKLTYTIVEKTHDEFNRTRVDEFDYVPIFVRKINNTNHRYS